MIDPTEQIRRQRAAEINVIPTSREWLEAKYGQVWTLDELRVDYEIEGFGAPLVVVRERATGRLGSFEFQHHPRFYFNYKPHKP